MNKTFFWADTHFNHKNIIRYCNRSFDSIEEMNEILAARWNSRISKQDRIYFLGDFMFTNRKDNPDFLLSRLNGQKFLIIGNHDSKHVIRAEGWTKTYRIIKITVRRQGIVLCHYPLFSWQGSCGGTWMIHGHCHGRLQDSENYNCIDFRNLPIKDVGVDMCPFPISFEELKKEMNQKRKSTDV